MYHISEDLPENEPVNKDCPRCEWYLRDDVCGHCGYINYKLENGNEDEIDRRMLRVQGDSEQRHDLEFN